MEFGHDESFDCLNSIVASKIAAKEAWEKFIDFHEQAVPKSYWESLRQIDINNERDEIAQWLTQVVTETPIPDDVVALWIGILKFADNGKEFPVIYIAGADNYDQDDIDWACDPVYLPENRYVTLGILQQIDDVAKTDEESYEFLDWILPLAYCSFVFDEITRTKLDKKLFLKSKSKLFVAVGHDNGDYMDLSAIE